MIELEDKQYQLILNLGLVVLSLLYFWPGGLFLQEVNLEIMGWPFFALWALLIAPILFVSIFYMKSRIKNGGADGDGI